MAPTTFLVATATLLVVCGIAAVTPMTHSRDALIASAKGAAAKASLNAGKRQEETTEECIREWVDCVLETVADPDEASKCLNFYVYDSTCCDDYEATLTCRNKTDCTFPEFDYIESEFMYTCTDSSSGTASPLPSLTPEENCYEKFESCYFESGGSAFCFENIVQDGKCCSDYDQAVFCAYDISASFTCEDVDPLSLAFSYEDAFYNCDTGFPPIDPRVCFPASASVRLDNGNTKTMIEIEIGDKVAVDNGAFSPVFFFSHRVEKGVFPFLRITTNSAGESLTLTASHYVYSNGELVPASRVAVGDMLTHANGSTAEVIRVEAVAKEGLYNPHTVHGDIVVDGFLTSGFTTAVKPRIATMLMLPLKIAYKAGLKLPAFLDGDAPRAVFSVLPVGTKSE